MPANHSYSSNYGKVKRLYPYADGRVYFSLEGGETKMNPASGYYYIPKDHDNYQSFVSLLYMAADSRRVIYTCTKPNLDADNYAVVVYLVVDF